MAHSGLQMLANQQKLMIKQKFEMLEAITGFETRNKYKVIALDGTELFYAAEESNCCARMCCGNARPFRMRVSTLPDKKPFLYFNRPFKCTVLCWNLPVMEVGIVNSTGDFGQNVQANNIGKVKNRFHCWDRKFNVCDSSGDVAYNIYGSCCQCASLPCQGCNKIAFDIRRGETDEKCGEISKVFSGCFKEAFTDADNFIIEFPPDANIEQKANLLAAVFLIDFLFFESNQNQNSINM